MTLRYRVGAGPAIATQTRDIGLGGAFLLSADPPRAGTRLTVFVEGSAGAPALELAAEVRWVASRATAEGGAGMGVQFVALDEAQRRGLEALLAQLPRDPP